MDIQECPAADLAIASLVIETIKALVNEEFVSCEQQMKWKTEALVPIFDQAAEKAEDSTIDSDDYLAMFGYPEHTAKASELWRFIWDTLNASTNSLLHWKPQIDVILKEGSLATRISKSIGPNLDRETMTTVYKKLASCLDQNKVFLP
jgi:carboxylate-amine ligase